MRIACPSCSAEYEVPDRLLAGPARMLRCSRCAAEFQLPRAEAPAAAAPEPPPADPPKPEPPPRIAEAVSASRMAEAAPAPPVPAWAPTPAEPETDGALARAWVASLIVVVGAAVALVVFRDAVMVAWPPATRLFVAIGLA